MEEKFFSCFPVMLDLLLIKHTKTLIQRPCGCHELLVRRDLFTHFNDNKFNGSLTAEEDMVPASLVELVNMILPSDQTT